MDVTTPTTKSPKGKETLQPLQGHRQQKRPRVPEQNRQRAAKACNECRRLKEKCEGGFPCARCIRTKRTCGFNRSSTFTPASRVSGGGAEHAERIKHLEDIARHFLGDVALALPDLQRISQKLKNGDLKVEADSSEVDLNELEDLKLEDETFTVREISQNTAREY